MKIRILSIALVILMIATLLVGCGTAAEEITLSETEKTATEGESFALTATVTPSDAPIVWSSSNDTVAAVSSNGTVFALRAGTATITVKALDDESVQAVCNVTVVEQLTIASVSIMDPETVEVKLTRAADLTAAQFSIKTKMLPQSSHLIEKAVKSITPSDDKLTYTVKIDPNNAIEAERLVTVTIKSIDGSTDAQQEAVFSRASASKTAYQYFRCTLGEKSFITIDVGNGIDVFTIIDSIHVDTLPDGLTLVKDKQAIYSPISVSGTPTKAGSYNSVFTYMDQYNTTHVCHVRWDIYSDPTAVSGYVPPVKLHVGVNAPYDLYIENFVIGGSGNYVYEFKDGKVYDGVTLSPDGILNVQNDTARSLTVEVVVKDAADEANLTTLSIEISVEASVTVSGKVTDSSNNGISANIQILDPTDGTVILAFLSEPNGVYGVVIAPGIYDVIISTNDRTSTSYYNLDLTHSVKDLVFALDVYRVDITFTHEKITNIGESGWFDAQNFRFGDRQVLYLPSGTYQLSTSGHSGIYEYTAKLEFTVNDAPTTATAVITSAKSPEILEIGLDEPFSINCNEIYLFKIEPTQTGLYYFYSCNNEYSDPRAQLLDSEFTKLTEDDDYDDYFNFNIGYECTAGKTYYLLVQQVDYHDETIDIVVSQTSPSFEQ